MLRKSLLVALTIVMLVGLVAITGCGSKSNNKSSNAKETTVDADPPKPEIEYVQEKKFDTLPYLLTLPKDYDPDADREWPLILILHARSYDMGYAKNSGLYKSAERLNVSVITLSPVTKQSSWTPERDKVMSLLDEVIKDYKVDPSRVYLTGFSIGGYATWAFGAKFHDRFAAIAPIAGGGTAELAADLVDMPIWAYHNNQDAVISVSKTEDMVAAVKEAGGKDVNETIYDEFGHDSWTKTYNDPAFYEWLLSKSLNSK